MRATLALVTFVAGCARVFGLDPVAIDQDATPPASAWTKIALGRLHACGIKPDQTLWCWGRNDRGQLGLGDTAPPEADVPMQVGVEATWIDVVANESHTCARRADLSLACWGENTSFVLGTGNVVEDSSTSAPTPVAGMWDAVATGDHQTCALEHGTQALWCWGADDRRQQLGNGMQAAPLQIVAGTNKWLAVATGSAHVCAIGDDHQLYCWGDGDFGEIGDGQYGTRATPVVIVDPVTAQSNWTAVAAGGETTCALDAARALWCWGDNTFGELGDRSDGGTNLPTRIAGPEATAAWTAIAMARHRVCGTTDEGQLWCWGDNRYAQLADPSFPDIERTEPGKLGAAGEFSAFGIGPVATCVIGGGGGGMQCAGHAAGGELGDGGEGAVRTPTKVVDGMKAVAAGDNVTCAIAKDGDRVVCWGRNSAGAIGDGTLFDRQTPTPVVFASAPPLTFKTVSVASHACVTTTVGTMYCWGDDGEAQLGDGGRSDPVTQPEVVPPPSGAVWAGPVDAGTNHTCAIDAATHLWCWGANSDGQCGQTGGGTVGMPKQVGVAWGAVGVGDFASCGIAGGAVQCWGGNSVGELGNGTTSGGPGPTPGALSPATAASDIALGGFFGCALLASPAGAIACWGDGEYGQLADGLDGNATSPKQVTAPAAAQALSAGKEFACAIDPGGKLWCWGRDQYAQLGTASPTFDDQHRAAAAVDVGASWTAVSAGRDHACALDRAGSVWCWGDNVHGEVGNGRAWRAQLALVH